jgi:T5orf172 domain
MEFEPTRSFAYRFSRYALLPELQQLPEVQSGDPFRLRDLAWPLIDEHLTPDQQLTSLPRPRSPGEDTMRQLIRFYVPLLANELGVFINLGSGYFRNQTDVDVSQGDLVDAAIEAGDEVAEDFEGHIYAFSFPAIIRDGVHPIKVGKTAGDVEARIADQCKGAATFEQPKLLGRWPVKRVGPTELAIHYVLKARGRHKDDAPGREWFNTTIAEVEAIVKFVLG